MKDNSFSITEEEFRFLRQIFADPYSLSIENQNISCHLLLADINDLCGVHISLMNNKEISLIDIDDLNDNAIVYDASKHHQVLTLLKRLRGSTSHGGSAMKLNRDGEDYYYLQNCYQGKMMLKAVISKDSIEEYAKRLYETVLANSEI